MKISNFIIGLIVASLVVTTIGLVLSNAQEKYGVAYDETEIETFDKLDEINTLSADIQDRVQNQTTDRSAFDVVGGFLSDAKDTLLIAAASYDVFFGMGNAALDDVGAPAIFRVALMTIMVILVFLVVILGTVLGREI